MKLISLLSISIGLGMDAFAVAICKGLSMKTMKWKKAVIVGIYFGIFQAIMPIMGYVLGIGLEEKIKSIDHWIIFLLLSVIGINMIKETFEEKKDHIDDSTDLKTMLILSIATSIDALAVGITLVLFEINIFYASMVIGIIAFMLSVIGVKIGNKFGDKYEKKAQIAGGIILIVIGIKTLVEHMY